MAQFANARNQSSSFLFPSPATNTLLPSLGKAAWTTESINDVALNRKSTKAPVIDPMHRDVSGPFGASVSSVTQ
jgi:hypothetical protein